MTSSVTDSSSPVDPAWDEAFLRVESYLRVHHLESRVLLNRLAAEIIVAARALALQRPAVAPVALAMEVTRDRIAAWFARAGTVSDWANDHERAHGRLALVTVNFAGRWSDYFLSPLAVPPELTAGMASFRFQPGPELRFSNMPPALLEFGFDETGNPQPRQQRLWLVVRAGSSWLFVLGLISAAWAASH